MKINFPMLTVALFMFTICYSQQSSTTVSKMDNMHTVTLKKGELLVVAVAEQKADKEAQLQKYFNTIMPTAMQNGLSFVGQLHIDEVNKANNYKPNNFIGLFKWPNMKAAMAFGTTFPPEKIKELRMPIWNEFKGHVIAIQNDDTLMIKEDKIYEVKIIWTKDMIKTKSIEKKGGTILLNQPIAAYEDLKGNKAPNQILIIEWDNTKAADTFNKKNLMKSEKEESFYTHFTQFPS